MSAPDWAAVENAVASIAIIPGGLRAGWSFRMADYAGATSIATVPLHFP